MKLTFLSQNRCKQLRSHRSIEPEFCTISRVPFRWCSLYGFNRYRAAAALTAATPIAPIDTSVTATATIATALTIITPSDSCCCCYNDAAAATIDTAFIATATDHYCYYWYCYYHCYCCYLSSLLLHSLLSLNPGVPSSRAMDHYGSMAYREAVHTAELSGGGVSEASSLFAATPQQT